MKIYKKNLVEVSLWWVELLAIKIFVLGIGIFGLFFHQNDVFAAEFCSEYQEFECNGNFADFDGDCIWDGNNSECISEMNASCSVLDEFNCDTANVMDSPCLWNSNNFECISEMDATCSIFDESSCDTANANDGPCLWDGNSSCLPEWDVICSIFDEFSCDTANASDGPCIWNGMNCITEPQTCSEYWTNSDACSNASLPETCVFDDQENICVGVNFCSDYNSSYMCSQDYGFFWDCFWDENDPGNCLSESTITSCNEFGNNDTMCTNNDTGLGCIWDNDTCIDPICSVLDESSCESSPVMDGPCTWNGNSCLSETNLINCSSYGSNSSACDTDNQGFGNCYWNSSLSLCKEDIVILPNSTNTTEIEDAFDNAGYTDNAGEFEWDKPISLIDTDGLIPTTITLTNNNFKLHLPQNLQFKQNNGINNYNSEIIPPTSYSVATVDNKDVISAISVGNETESIKLINDVATLSIYTPTASISDPVSIYSSQDGTNWILEKGGIVSDLSGQPYVTFPTNHFTYFAIAGSTWSFVINNDDSSTSSPNVTLTISAPTANYMRFSNISWSNRSSWEAYTTSKSWTLDWANWEKAVYAQFDTDGNTGTIEASTFDTIMYSNPSAQEWQLTLEILTWTSECVYGTSLNLSWQNVKLNEWYTFTGSFSGQWYCADYIGVNDGWSLTIQVSDLTNAGWNIISGSNILISHGWATTQWDSACTGSDGTPSQFSSAPYTLIEKSSWSDKICKVTLDNVNLEVNVPAFQAPGNYNGTLTLTVPNF